MLIALLAVDTALKTSVKNFKRRGILNNLVQESPEENNTAISNLRFDNTDIHLKQINKMGFDGDKLPAAVNLDDMPCTSFIDRNIASIVFNAGDKRCCHEISGTNVQVYTNANNHDHGSSKVKLKNIVDYKWEEKHYPGHLIAVHIDQNTIAYVINVNNKLARMEGMVRVFNISKGFRSLIKGMSGEILDLQFAHIENQRILACIDMNSLYVNKIDELERSLVCNAIVKIDSPLNAYVPKYDKIAWCPFIDIPGEDDEDNQLIVWARGSRFQCFNINIIVAKHGSGKMNLHDIKTGFVKYEDSSITITWIALSPDGSTLGVGSTDGFIRFYQIYIYDKDPRCLHEWQPHDGKAISSFFFLDNLTKNNSDAYWKHAITAADCNTEFKVWDCGNWNCLQTVNILNGSDIKKPLRFIAEIDRTASYVVISSLENRACYILQVINNCTSRHLESDESLSNKDISCSFKSQSSNSISKYSLSTFASNVYIKSISEFPLNSGILSFSIVNAAIRRYKCAGDNYLCEELDDYDEETNSIYCVVIHMYIVQSKSMQECHILYQPKVQAMADIKSTISNSSHSLHSKNSNNNKSNKNSNMDAATSDDVSSDYCDVDNGPVNELTLDMTSSSKLLNINSSHQNLSSPSTGSTVVPSSGHVSEPLCVDVISETNNITIGKSFTQVNLMTPDAFNSTSMERKTPEDVSTEVLNTILMLATVTGSNPANSVKPEKANMLNLTNNTIIEKQELQNHDVDTQNSFICTGHGILTGTDILISGSSSPSREVQEIMRVQHYDNSDDEILGDAKEEVSKTTNVGENHQSEVDRDENPWQKAVEKETDEGSGGATSYVASVTVNIYRGKSEGNFLHMSNIIKKMHKASEQGSSRHNIDLNRSEGPVDWQTNSTPEGPLTDLQNAASRMYQVVKSSSFVLPNNVAPALGNSNKSNINNITNSKGAIGAIVADTRSAKNNISLQIKELTDLVKMQTSQISLLQNEINQLKSANTSASVENVSNNYKIELQLSKLIEQHLKQYETEHKRKLSTFLTGKDVQYRELRDSIIQTINKSVNMQFSEIVPKVVNNEVQRQLIPLISSKLDILQQKMQHDFIKKLSSFDLLLQENIGEVCKSKTIIDVFSKSVLSGVQNSLQTAFIETMSGTLIPAYEKSSQNMFTQLHEAFSIGIKEFMEQFDNYLNQLQPIRDAAIDEMLDKFIAFNQSLEAMLDKHLNCIHKEITETRQDVKSLEIMLTRQIQEVIRVEVRKSLEVQAAALRSQASTPAQMFDNKDTIKHFLIQGHINKAFHQALLANDLNLVEFTLKSADHNSVFTPECCLEQKVLLSLIQQISADMSNHNEVKQNYLAEALLAINPIDPITREHAPKVLDELFRNCQVFLYKYPKSPQCSNVRMLMKAVQAYKGQF